MADKKWAVFSVPAVGQVAAWIDPDALVAGEPIDAENLTHLIAGPRGQLGMGKIVDKAALNLAAMSYWFLTPPDLSAALSKAWDVAGQIVQANNGDMRKIEKLPRFKLE